MELKEMIENEAEKLKLGKPYFDEDLDRLAEIEAKNWDLKPNKMKKFIRRFYKDTVGLASRRFLFISSGYFSRISRLYDEKPNLAKEVIKGILLHERCALDFFDGRGSEWESQSDLTVMARYEGDPLDYVVLRLIEEFTRFPKNKKELSQYEYSRFKKSIGFYFPWLRECLKDMAIKKACDLYFSVEGSSRNLLRTV